MDTDAKAANEWASLMGCARNLERILKNSQRLVDDASLEHLSKATQDYLERYHNFLEMKKARDVK